MRPSSGGESLPTSKPRSRKHSNADRPAAHNVTPGHVPTTFFLRSEEDMERSVSGRQESEAERRQGDSTFGVESLADTLEAAFGQDNNEKNLKTEETNDIFPQHEDEPEFTSRGSPKAGNRQANIPSSLPIKKHARTQSNTGLTASLTPIDVEAPSPMPTSAMPSTPKSVSLQSLKLSDEESGLDEVASQAIMSSEDDEDEIQQSESSSFPQLVMPSIQMPTRRPFTTRGKAMGKLKILIAGESGVGKTALLRSIVQLCEDIVHVDPLSPTQTFSHSPPPSKSKSRKRKMIGGGTRRITEIHASTRSYPHWWTDNEDSRLFRRRKSVSDAVLERNLCFIDTPGFGGASSGPENQSLVVDYVESLLHQNSSITTMEDNDLLGVISGSGGIQVDLVLYLVSPDHDISKDVDFMQRLSSLTNVLPIISKSDLLSPAEIVAVKTSILARLQNTAIRPFFFGKALDEALLAVQSLSVLSSTSGQTQPSGITESRQYPFNFPTYPYAISTTHGSDAEVMDASLLMSPDYVQPLLPSELSTLVHQIFDPESIDWLRHSSAKKFLAWRRQSKLARDPFVQSRFRQPATGSSISSSSVGLNGAALHASGTSSIFCAASPSGVLVPRATSPFYLSHHNLQSPFSVSSPSLSHTSPDRENPTDFSLTQYTNYVRGEGHIAEVRLAKWATDLQRSVRNERERFENLQRNERARWLLERVSEEVKEGNIVRSPDQSPRADWAVVRRGNTKENDGLRRYDRTRGMDSRDPLGICDLSDEVKRRGFVLVKVLGSVSVLGAVMVAVIKACGMESALPEGSFWLWITGASD